MSTTETLHNEAHLGRHILSISPDEGRRLDLVASAFRAGMTLDCRCLYIPGRQSHEAILDGLWVRGCEVDKALESGQLLMVGHEDTYTRGGRFDPDRMLDVWVRTMSEARRDGFEGLCATGEPAWLSDGVPGSDRWLEYEARLNLLDLDGRATIICQYDGLALPAYAYDELRKSHPFIHRGNAVEANSSYVDDPSALPDVPLLEELERPLDTLPCEHIRELLSAGADEELSPPRREALARHLAECSECAARAAALRDLTQAVKALKAPAAAPEAFWQRVQAQLAGEARPGAHGQRPRRVAAHRSPNG